MNEKDLDGSIPLHYACLSGRTATAVALIERGASVSEKIQIGWTSRIKAMRGYHRSHITNIFNVNQWDYLL